METRDINSLKLYEENNSLRQISKAAYSDLIHDLQSDGQLSTVLVMPDGTVLGGNHRIRAMKEIGIAQAKVQTIDFIDDGANGWYVVLDGEERKNKRFTSKEQAMFYYSTKHNGNYASYNVEALVTYVDKFELPYEDVRVNVFEIDNLKTIQTKAMKKESEDKYFVMLECGTDTERDEVYNKVSTLGLNVKIKKK